MSHLIRLSSDIGELRIWVATILLRQPLTDDVLGRVKSVVSGCPGSLITIVPARKVLNTWHMIYPAYLSLRDYLRGVSRFKDPGLGALAYMAGTTQLRRGLSVMGPVGNDQLSIILMGINDCVHDLVGKVVSEFGDLIEDLVIGVGCHRVYEGLFKTIDEFMDSLINSYISGFT